MVHYSNIDLKIDFFRRVFKWWSENWLFLLGIQMVIWIMYEKQTWVYNSTLPHYSKNIWYSAIIWGRIVARLK